MILTDREIQIALRTHQIIIELYATPIGSGALKEITSPFEIDSDVGYDLAADGTFVLGWTAEYVKIPVESRLAARVEGKSSLARLGIGIHVTAPTIHAGFDGQIRLEIINHGCFPITLKPRMRNLPTDF